MSTVDKFEEENYIIKLPDDVAAQFDSGNMGSITISDSDDPNGKYKRIRIGSNIFDARLYDLPRSVEGYKTLDRKGYYKCSDIQQILVVAHNKNELPLDDVYPDGLTSPLKDISKRTQKPQYPENIAEYEKEIKPNKSKKDKESSFKHTVNNRILFKETSGLPELNNATTKKMYPASFFS